ncbi:hypothetical protein [Psychroflexus aestuariivivens]|uniref:hypothetical protein n=1 Tax=Psychroflexus aestuariivivens TaxID=1795040 RepID=UPI000FDA2934|nr:hypothetical protein [Psychroflexus aestuariivivens]
MDEAYTDFEDIIEMMDKFDKEVFKVVFPHSNFDNSYNAGEFSGKFNYKDLFKETNYEVSKDDSYIHFTSLQALTCILNYGYFRLSEFRHLEDIEELHFASGVFNNSEVFSPNTKNISDHKKNCFALSACINDDETR